MCRNIKPLFNFEPPASEDEIRASAIQYVRKVSGFTKPSTVNEEAFLRAIDEITASTSKLLNSLTTTAAAKSRDDEIAKKRALNAKRFSS